MRYSIAVADNTPGASTRKPKSSRAFSIRVDGTVVVEGEWGWIEEIESACVMVRIWDLRRLILPLTYFYR